MNMHSGMLRLAGLVMTGLLCLTSLATVAQTTKAATMGVTPSAFSINVSSLVNKMAEATTSSIVSIAEFVNLKNRTQVCSGRGSQLTPGGLCVCYVGFTGAVCQTTMPQPPPPDRNPSSPRDDADGSGGRD